MGFVDKILLLYLCLCIACAFWQPQLIFTQNTLLGSVFDVDYNKTTDTPNLPGCDPRDLNCFGSQYKTNTANQSTISQMFNQLGGSTGNYFIDALNNVLGFFSTIFKIAFSPFIIFASPSSPMYQAPSAVFYLIALPMVLLFIIAIINWIRTGIT